MTDDEHIASQLDSAAAEHHPAYYILMLQAAIMIRNQKRELAAAQKEIETLKCALDYADARLNRVWK